MKRRYQRTKFDHFQTIWSHRNQLYYFIFSFLQVQEVLNNLKCLSSTATSIVGTLRTADKEVQTEFPFELLEDYVVNNRKRILKLLGMAS